MSPSSQRTAFPAPEVKARYSLPMVAMATGVSFTNCARPLYTFCMARVVMKAGMRMRAMSRPFTRPMPAPRARITRQESTMLKPGFWGASLVTMAVNTTEDRAIWEATDRSKSPEMMAKVMPMPHTAYMDASLMMVA